MDVEQQKAGAQAVVKIGARIAGLNQLLSGLQEAYIQACENEALAKAELAGAQARIAALEAELGKLRAADPKAPAAAKPKLVKTAEPQQPAAAE